MRLLRHCVSCVGFTGEEIREFKEIDHSPEEVASKEERDKPKRFYYFRVRPSLSSPPSLVTPPHRSASWPTPSLSSPSSLFCSLAASLSPCNKAVMLHPGTLLMEQQVLYVFVEGEEGEERSEERSEEGSEEK